MSYSQHLSDAQSIRARCAIITLSDTRTQANDSSGEMIRRLLEEHQHQIASYRLIRDEPAELRALLNELTADADIDAIFTNGGTGISRRDQTIDVIARTLEVELSGFGELFRMLSWQQIGSGAMLSRAVGGIARGKLIFAMPGSTKAVQLAMTKLIIPELRHLLGEIRKS